MRLTGPEMGASTCVLWSPSKATVPLTSTVGRKSAALTTSTWIRARWEAVSPKAAPWSASTFAPPCPQAAHSTATITARRSMVMAGSGGIIVQGSADRALQVGARIVGGAEGIGVLAFGVEQGPTGVEHVEGRGAAEPVARQGDLVGSPGLGEQMVAQVDRLLQCGGCGGIRGAHVFFDLRFEIGVGGVELTLAMLRLRHFTALVVPEEEGHRDADARRVGAGRALAQVLLDREVQIGQPVLLGQGRGGAGARALPRQPQELGAAGQRDAHQRIEWRQVRRNRERVGGLDSGAQRTPQQSV